MNIVQAYLEFWTATSIYLDVIAVYIDIYIQLDFTSGAILIFNPLITEDVQMVEGSFDEATQGVDCVFHTASPVFVPYDDNVQAKLATT